MILSSDKKVIFRSNWLPWVLIAPQGFIVLAFFFWPAGQALLQSFHQSDAFGMSVQWSGLDNFAALWRDDTYLESFKTTALFSVLVAGLGISLSLALAFFADRVGLVAYVLDKCGISWNILLNSHHAMTLIVIASVWKQISYNFLFFLAGFQSIPKSLVEAAAIDGASVWQRFWTVQLPLLTPTLFFLLVVNTVYAFFETFGIVDATTRGGPGKDTAILVYKVYFDGFKAMDLGGSAAQSVVLMAIVIGLTVLQFRYIERKVHY